jgi:hypothetical protein
MGEAVKHRREVVRVQRMSGCINLPPANRAAPRQILSTSHIHTKNIRTTATAGAACGEQVAAAGAENCRPAALGGGKGPLPPVAFVSSHRTRYRTDGAAKDGRAYCPANQQWNEPSREGVRLAKRIEYQPRTSGWVYRNASLRGRYAGQVG